MLFVCATLLASCADELPQSSLPTSHYTTKQLLSLLDADVDQRQTYIQQREAHIDNLKELLTRTAASARFDVADAICGLYVGFNADSVRHYSELCRSYASNPEYGSFEQMQRVDIHQANSMATNGLYEDARRLLLPLREVVTPGNKLDYFKTMDQLLNWESSFSTLPNALDANIGQIIACQDSILRYETDPMYAVHQRAILAGYDDQRQALQIALPVLDTMRLDNPNLRYLANTVAGRYEALAMPDSARHYYALSAISDLRQGVLEHASLPRLAVMLFAAGDTRRAYNYMKCSMEDAEQCGARLRTVQMAEQLPIILEAYENKVNAQHARLQAGLMVLALLLLGISALFFLLMRTHRRLREARRHELAYHEDLRQSKLQVEHALRQVREINNELKAVNEELKQSNRELKESNQIKETYVTQYMKQCSAGIAKIEGYRVGLQKTAMSSNYAKLVQTIKDTKVIDKELDDFYHSFDETFLSLFPTFISDFNALLKPDEQLSEPESGGLTTELRIFALIRLGITSSEEIADFLRYSVKTIYNYRTRIRSKAEGDRNLLEEKLMKIGVVGI